MLDALRSGHGVQEVSREEVQRVTTDKVVRAPPRPEPGTKATEVSRGRTAPGRPSMIDDLIDKLIIRRRDEPGE